MLRGCDLSHWNSDKQFDWVFNYADFFILKATESVGYKDPTCTARMDKLIQAGKLTGLYHFFSNADITKQVENFGSIYYKYQLYSIPVLDVENRQTDWDKVKKFIKLFVERYGTEPILYVDNAHYNAMPDILKTIAKIWIARYNSKLTTKDIQRLYNNVIMWQYTDQGLFNGHAFGRLDCDYFFGDIEDWKKLI